MKKTMFWAALSMTVALLITACSSGNDTTETPVTPVTPPTPTKTIIPYSVTVNNDATETRASVASDNRTLTFDSNDQLYITGTNIQGVLTANEGVSTASCTFNGELIYTGSGTPGDNLPLTATLVSQRQRTENLITVDEAGAVTVNYPTTAYCATINDAVQQYSVLTGTSTFGAKSFTLTQHTAFLNFVIQFEDGTSGNTTLSAVVSNGGTAICTADVTTTTETAWYDVKATFVLPVAAGTTLDNATVTLGNTTPISFGASQTLTGKVYNVKKTRDVSIQRLCPDDNHPHAIDLGLPSGTEWACQNVGAHTPDQYGSYFAWGETESDTPYQTDWSRYLFSFEGNDGNSDSPYFCHLTRYCSHSNMGQAGFTDGLTELVPADDAATANWGDNWCMPTYTQTVELNNSTYVSCTWTTVNGVEGQLFTSTSNGNCIFLPFTLVSQDEHQTKYGYYWSSTRQTDWSTNAWNIYINFDYSTYDNANYRYHCQSVRPVRKVTQ